MRAVVVDDDPIMVRLLIARVIEAGHEVRGFQNSTEAFNDVAANPPDFVLVDIMMPGMDGMEFCRKVRENPALAATKVIIVTSKGYDYDRRQAAQVGANGYITKPITEDFPKVLANMLSPSAEIRFWGVRGTLPTPGKDFLRYGGNTSCVSMQFGRDHMFIFDGGSGIKNLGNYLMGRQKRVTAHMLISHPHWDHINAIPFFVPLYIPGNEIAIAGAAAGDISMRKMITDQMDSIYFPVTIREFGARVYFQELGEQVINVDGVTVRTMLLSHPGKCLGYRLEVGGRVLCYVTDNELYPADLPQHDDHYERLLTAFCKDADMLITDVTYLDDAYRKKVTWGHSCPSEVCRIANLAGVKELYLFHHDPDQTDKDIDIKLEQAIGHMTRMGSSTKVIAPAEGDVVTLPLTTNVTARAQVPIV